MRLVLTALAGVAVAVAGAIVVGDYPLSGSVPWLAALVVPGLVGTTMAFICGHHQQWLWVATGPLAALSLAWGFRIATGWGLDPIPASCWAAMAIALLWPLGWAGLVAQRGASPGRGHRTAPSAPAAPAAPSAGDGELSH